MSSDSRRLVLLLAMPIGSVATIATIARLMSEGAVAPARLVALVCFGALLAALSVVVWRRPQASPAVGASVLIGSAGFLVVQLAVSSAAGEIPDIELLAQLQWLPVSMALAFVILPGRKLPIAFCLVLITCVTAIVLTATTGVARRVAFEASTLSPLILIALLVFVGAVKKELRATQEALGDATLSSERDALTGASNRRAAERMFPELKRAGGAIIVFDLDDFKKLNDTQGHAAGDRALQSVTKAARQTLRPSDRLIRWGGEEFVAFLQADADVAVGVAHRIAAAVRDLGAGPRLTVSVGVACVYPEDDLLTAFKRADQAMYAAKRAGKDRVVIADRR